MATCLGAHPICPPYCPLSRFLPCPLWWLDPLLGDLSWLSSSSHSPGVCPVLRDSPRLPWTRISQTQGSQLPSGQVAPQFPGMRCAQGCSAGGVVREPRGICVYKVCGSARAFPQPQASPISQGLLQSLRSPCCVSQPSLPTSPKAKEGGNSFHNKSPAPGLGGQSRLEQWPRC